MAIVSARKAVGPVAVTTALVVATLVAVLASAGAAPARDIRVSQCSRAPGHGLTLANMAAAGPRLVAVGSNGLIATASSSAPARWAQQPSLMRHDLRGVVWTGSRWVAVGDLGTILSSTDAHAWGAASGIPSVGLRAIAAKPGLVVAAGSGGALLSSLDGLAWTPQPSGTSEILWGAARMGSTLLMSGKDATVIASMDGSSWQAVPTYPHPTDDQAAPRPFLWQLAAAGPRLVAVGDFGSVLDGSLTSLRAIRSPTDEILRGIAFGHGTAVAVGSSGVILRAVGGGRWASVPSPTTVDLRGVTYTGTRFVAAGDQSTIISSRDGLRWQIETTAMPCALLAVAHGAGRYIAVGGAGQLLSSIEGRVWTASQRPTSEDLYALAHGPFGFVAAGADGTVLQSTDGRRWVARRLRTKLNLHTVSWTGRNYLIGGDRGRLFASVNGARWRRLPILAFHSIRGLATVGTTTVAAGAGTVARRSSNGKWTLEAVGFGRFQTSIAASDGRFVIVGHNGEALVSTDDGRTWTPGNTGAEINLDCIVFSGGRFIATGEGMALSSRDGLTWSTLTLPTVRSIRSIAINRSALVAVGDADTILRSTDRGLSWRPAARRG